MNYTLIIVFSMFYNTNVAIDTQRWTTVGEERCKRYAERVQSENYGDNIRVRAVCVPSS